jgi:hypothetical protein
MFKRLRSRWAYKPTEQEQQFINIINELLSDPKTSLKMTPESHKYYLTNNPKHYYVMVKEQGIQVTNGKFSFAKMLHQKAYSMIINNIHAAMEVDRQKFEDAIFQNESKILDSVLYNLKK